MKIKELSKFSKLLFFTKDSLRQIEKDESSLNFNIKYWLKKKKIILLKKGFYVLKERWEREVNKQLYLEYLANKIYEPSYLSCEYVMSKYSLLTEAVYGITSIARKKTKTFDNNLGKFSYYSISPALFSGYVVKKFYSAPILIASKSKAVFDYLYLRFLKLTPINKKSIIELRINWENVSFREFAQLEKYAEKTRSLRIKQAIKLIKKLHYA